MTGYACLIVSDGFVCLLSVLHRRLSPTHVCYVNVVKPVPSIKRVCVSPLIDCLLSVSVHTA